LVTTDPTHELVWLCDTAVSMTGVSSCGVTMVTRAGQSVTAYATSKEAHAVENLQHTLGEGPGVAASDSGAAVLVPDLQDRSDRSIDQWPTFAAESRGTGIRAAFAFPLLLGTLSIGALSLYRRGAGQLTPEGISRGWVTADAVALSLADPGEPVGRQSDLMDPMRVHQAAGMVTVQLDLPIDQALVRMRATAFAEGVTVDELADAIVERRRRLSKEDT
jgi:GAF domain-containing protein